jgi:hypothetical protein
MTTQSSVRAKRRANAVFENMRVDAEEDAVAFVGLWRRSGALRRARWHGVMFSTTIEHDAAWATARAREITGYNVSMGRDWIDEGCARRRRGNSNVSWPRSAGSVRPP